MFSFILDDQAFSIIKTQTNCLKYFPYIIHYLSPSYIPMYLSFKVPPKKKITHEMLIGISFGSASIFF